MIGAGTMGVGIAICFANAAIPVTILDISDESLKQGLDRIDHAYETMVKRGRLTQDEKQRRMSHIRGTLDYTDLRDADVIIEAIFESMDLKRKIFAALDQVAKPAADWVPHPPVSLTLEAPSPQFCNSALTETAWVPPCALERNIERVAPVIAALVGIEVRSNAINPRRKASLLVLPAKR